MNLLTKRVRVPCMSCGELVRYRVTAPNKKKAPVLQLPHKLKCPHCGMPFEVYQWSEIEDPPAVVEEVKK